MKNVKFTTFGDLLMHTKNKKFIALLIILLPIFLKPEKEQTLNPKVAFEKASNLYKKGDYESAMELYKKIPDKSAIVNYNLGNCAYKLNQLGFAYLYWKRAEKNWGPWGRTELLNNLKVLKEKLAEQKKIGKSNKKDPILQEFKTLKLHVKSFIYATPLIYFQIVFLLLWISLFLLIRRLFKNKKKSLIFMLFTLIAISGLMLISKYNFEFKQIGIIISKEAKLLSGPGDKYQFLGFVPEAKEVIIQKASSGFYKVKINGQLGWINQIHIEKV